MDQIAKEQAFNYVKKYNLQPSNLCVQRESSKPLRSSEPTGEPETLSGRVDIKLMGTYAAREKPQKLQQVKQQKNPDISQINPKKKTQIVNQNQYKNVRNYDNAANVQLTDQLIYRPRTKDNRQLYELLLSKINQLQGDESQETILSTADEILAVLKSENMKDIDKKTDIEAIIGKIDQEFFTDLLTIASHINDYTTELVQDNVDRYEEELRVNLDLDEVEMQEDENNEESNFESENEEKEDQVENQDIITAAKETVEQDNEMSKYDIPVSQIHEFWLINELTKHMEPMQAHELEGDILEILAAKTDMECENKLISILNYDKFSLIKLLMVNRKKIYYCIKLNQAKTQIEKQEIFNKIKNDNCEYILESLDKVKLKIDSHNENIKQIKKQAAELHKNLDDQQVQQEFFEQIAEDDFNYTPKKLIDLDSLVFVQGSHFMSNEKCKVPKGSTTQSKKGYDEVYIPAVKRTDEKEQLVAISDLPPWAQETFPKIKSLNRIQSEVYKSAFKNDENLLVCAPTGAGKTNIALLAMLQTISQFMKDGVIEKDKFKMVYIAPMKALVNEIVGNFQKRLEPLGLVVKELTGDSQLSKQQIQETQLIVATPEKWDIITRKSGEKTYTELVKLLIIDEIHLLHDSRGPVLEAIVTRTIRLIQTSKVQIRIVGLSATLPNYQDVAAFLRVKPKDLYFFDSSYRPIPLEQVYIGITEKKGIRKMLLANEIMYEKVIERAGKSQMIIFVHSRRETIKVAQSLKEMAYAKDELGKFLKENSASQTILQSETENVKNSAELKDLLPFGFAIHHAGMNRVDRTLVEDLFADRHIQVLVSTSTLAWGVNLPAHTVIIKGTQIYSPEQGKWVELSPQDVLQMMGRAGRPKYDTKGEGIIITGYQELKYYLSLLNQQLPIESQFVSQLADQLNAEIVQGTVHNLRDAVNWLGYTYFYIRMRQSPKTYFCDLENDPNLIQRRVDLIHSAAMQLDKNNLIKYDKKSGSFQTTVLGKIASHYYVKHPSISVYNEQIQPNMSLIEIMQLFSLSSEFKYIPVRDEEKQEIQKLLNSVPLPIKGSPNDTTTKVNVLLQAYISKFKLDGYALNADMIFITQSAGRIMRAIFEIFLKKGWSQPAQIALNCCKMINKQMWPCMTPLRQFKGIPDEILRRIEKKEQLSWDHLYNLTPQQIGETVKFPTLGKYLHKFIHQFPRIEIAAFVQPITRSCLQIEMTVTPDFHWDEKLHGNAEPFWILVEDCDGETLLYNEYFVLKKKHLKEKNYVFEFTVPLYDPLHPIYYIKVVSDRWLNCESQLPISFKNLILPEKFCPPTELLDLQLLPIKVLKWAQAELLFQSLNIQTFNSIQTQTFQAFYQSDDSTFLGSASGSGKSICALLAILRQFKEHPQKKVVYVAPIESLCQQKLKQWGQLFQEILNKSVCILTGQSNADNKLIEKYDVIISKPEYWDILSRRWKQRKFFQKIGLFIVDELHLLSESGSVLEVITSRMRFITTQLDSQIRMVGLSTSLANYKDMAEWIGAVQVFNFHPSVRPVPLEIAISGFDQNNQNSRLLAMQKQIYFGIKQHSKQKSVIIFVSDRKQARISALDLVTMIYADNDTKQFISAPIDEICSKIHDKNLQHVLQFGIGMIYEGMDISDREIVEELFSSQLIQIIICTYKLSWDLTLQSYCVMIMDTSRYDGQEKRYVDYTIPDMLQMISRATSQKYNNAKCLVYCHQPKKDYYKKFLFEPYPCESHLNHFLADHLNSEIVAKTIQNKQDCVDWITWTFMYRRLTQNPNYYNLQEVSGEYVNDYLSELIELTTEQLETNKCIAIEEQVELLPLNFGYISSYYYIKTDTIELFSKNLDSQSKMKNILEILAQSSEFEFIPIRHREDHLLKMLQEVLVYKIDKPKFNDPVTKTNILLQCHFSRKALPADFSWDQKLILEQSIRLISAMVDVMSSNCWLKPAILAIQLCQMIIQAVWIDSAPLLQLPHFTDVLAQKFQDNGIQDIADFMNMEEDLRNQLLNMDQEKVANMAEFCNRYPSISIEYNVQQDDETVQVDIVLSREGQDEDSSDFVVAPYFPKPVEENWWVLIGDNKQNKLHVIKRLKIGLETKVTLTFNTPDTGKYNLTLYVLCDSYVGCDQGEKFDLIVPIKMEKDQS